MFDISVKIMNFKLHIKTKKKATTALCCLPEYQTSFESTDLSVQEKLNIYFHDDCCRWERFYIFLIYKSLQFFLSSFQSIGRFVQKKTFKIGSFRP